MNVSGPNYTSWQQLLALPTNSLAKRALVLNYVQPSSNNGNSGNASSDDNYTQIVDKNGKSPTGTNLVKGRIGWIDTRNLRVVYEDNDLRKDSLGNYVPKEVEAAPGERYEADLKSNEKNIEHWSERSTCYLSINNGATLLGAVHAGKNIKVISKDGDLWQAGSKSRIVDKNDYKYFEANEKCDLSIFVENTDKGYKKTIEWLSNIMLNPKIPFSCNEIESRIKKGDLRQLRFITNRLPGCRQEQINGKIYDKVRNHTQNGEANLINGETIGVNQDEYRIYGIIPRDENSKCIYHGASGSPVLIGKDGTVGILSAAELYYDIPPDCPPEEVKYLRETQKSFSRILHAWGYIKDEDPASLKDFMQKYNIIHVTPLTKEVASSLLAQVSKEYEKFKKQQWQDNLARAS